MFRARKQSNEESMDDEAQDVGFAAETSLKELPIENLHAGKWHIQGMYMDQVWKVGLRRLDELFESKGLLTFPKRQNGTALIRDQNLFAHILSKKRDLKSVPTSDVSSLQGDIKNLSLVQLLKLRVLTLGFDARNAVHDAHAALLEKVNVLLLEKLAEKALENSGLAVGDAATTFRFGGDLVFISAAASALATHQWWVCWYGENRAFFNVKSFKSSMTFPSSGVLEITDKSAPDPNSGGMQYCFDWMISLTASEDALSSVRVTTSALESVAAGLGANLNAPQVTLGAVQNARASLKQTQ
jgi:hypothetical protein